MWTFAERQVNVMPRIKSSTSARPKQPEATYPQPLAYTIDGAVKASGLGRSSIYKLMAEGKLLSVRVAGRRLILVDALRNLLRGE
jgi:hypothetical protein